MHNRDFFCLLFLFQVLTLLSVVFNIFLVRQVFSFLFLAILPGFLFLKIFRVNLVFLKTVIYSLGLSLALLMVLGLLLNTLLPEMGVLAPLTTINIVFSMSIVTLFLSFLLLKRDRFIGTEISQVSSNFKLPSFAILLVVFPFLTILGAELANFSKNTIILMLLTVFTMIIVFCIFFKRLLPRSSYPLALFLIAFFLLIGTSLVSNYLLGTDVQVEFYFAKLTNINSFWNYAIAQQYNGMLSVTVLPVIFAKFMNFDIEWIFKFVYPLIYCLVPITLYLAYRKQTNPTVAFLGVFLFMSMDTFFLQMLGLARQMVAELFFALIILLFVEETLSISKKRVLFVIFSFILIVSHYSLAYLFAFLVLLSLLINWLFNRGENKSKPLILPVMASVYILAILGWNLLVSPSAFNSLLQFVTFVSGRVSEFSQTPGVTGLMPAYLSPLHDVSKYVFLLVQGLIVIGLFELIVKRKKRLNVEYSAMCVGSFAVLVLMILVPSFGSAGLNETRFYHIALFFLAPLCITGTMFLAGLAMKIKSKLFSPKTSIARNIRKKIKLMTLFLITVLIVSFFAFQVGFVYEVAGDVPTSITLSIDRPKSWTLYMNQLVINDRQVAASQWMLTYSDNNSKIYADIGNPLLSYGMVEQGRLFILDPAISPREISSSYFFLGKINVNGQNGQIIDNTGFGNITDFSSILNSTDKIYTSGNCDIYKGFSS
jgi:uncharacterized membrane protein